MQLIICYAKASLDDALSELSYWITPQIHPFLQPPSSGVSKSPQISSKLQFARLGNLAMIDASWSLSRSIEPGSKIRDFSINLSSFYVRLETNELCMVLIARIVLSRLAAATSSSSGVSEDATSLEASSFAQATARTLVSAQIALSRAAELPFSRKFIP
jgi:hypothetical protein